MKEFYVKIAVKCFELYLISDIRRIIYLSMKIKYLLTLRTFNVNFKDISNNHSKFLEKKIRILLLDTSLFLERGKI